MTSGNVMNISIENVTWQDYRASNTSMVLFYTSDPVSELPIREIPEELPSDVLPEPHYETGTYGYYGCSKAKVRNAFVKSKIRYILFMTKYSGTLAEFKDRIFVTGFYRVHKIADAKKIHIRFCPDYSCLDEDHCYSMRADEKRFVAIGDAFEITDAVLKKWGYTSKITKQTRIQLDEEQTLEVVNFLSGKPDATPVYVMETKRLWPAGEESEEDVEE
jgi:hypothetical protein